MAQAAPPALPRVSRSPAVPAPAAAPEYRPPYRLALLVGTAVFALYALTLAPTTSFWDTSEYITTSHILGIPHPPGNPVFVMFARAWEALLAPTGLSTAVRINLFSALMGALSFGFFFLVTHRILAWFTPSEGVRRAGAAAGVALGATAFTVWNQSNVNEKVYTISLATIAILSWIAFRWRDRVEAHSGTSGDTASGSLWHDDNLVVLALYLLALSVGNHLMTFLAAPALGLFLLLVKPRTLGNWRLYAAAVAVGVVGLSAHLFLPIRAGLDPIINEADPSCPSLGSSLTSVLTLGKAGCAELSAALAREQYQKPPVTERLAPFGAQLLNYFQYFDWQWSRSLQGRVGYLAPARLPFTLLFVVLGVFGALEHFRRDRKSFAYLATLFATLSVGLVFYMNFKYGYGQVQAWGQSIELAEVRERDYFYIVSFALWGLWSGIGLTALWLRLARSLEPRRNALALASPVLALALLPMVLNWSYASRRGDYAARDWAYNLLQSVEPYGVLFTNGDNDTFPLWYVQEVEGVRRDVTVIVMSYLNTPWYAKQLRDLTQPCPQPNAWAADPTRIVCQRPFEPSQNALYANPRKPTRSILPLQDGQIDAVTAQGYAILPQDVVFQARNLEVVLPAQMPLLAAQQFALQIIKDAWGDRPIFFAMTTNAHRELGLERSVARHGMAHKLVDPAEARGLMPVPENHPLAQLLGGYMDLGRTRALVDRVFRYGNLAEQDHWTDDATRGVPTYFGSTLLVLAEAENALGNTAAAQRYNALAEKYMALSER